MAVLRVSVRPEMLRWACERSNVDVGSLTRRLPPLSGWLSGDRRPTLRQLEKFAAATRTPVGVLLMSEPLDEPLPIPDYRTVRDRPVGRPSLDLLHTIYACEERQTWYRDHARLLCAPVLFVRTMGLSEAPQIVAARMRRVLQVDLEHTRYQDACDKALDSLKGPSSSGSGGDFYNPLRLRTGRRFQQALLSSTLEGTTLYRDAFRLLGIRQDRTFRELATCAGFAV